MRYPLAILVFLYTSALYATPDWYQNRHLEASQNELVGYGQGKSMQAARNLAGQDIAFQMGIDISVTTTKKSRLENKQFHSSFTEDIRQLSQQKLSNLDIIKSEQDGDWFVAVKTTAIPYWFESRVYKAGPDQKIGYGSASNLRKAQLNAAEEIALQMGGKIKVDTTKTTKLSNSTLEKSFSQDIQLVSEHEIGNIRLINIKRIKNIWYVAAEVGDKRHFSLKLTDHLKKSGDACSSSSQSNYLKNMAAIKPINQALNCTPALRLSRSNNGRWHLSAKKIKQALTGAEFKELLTPVQSHGLSISSKKSTVYESDSYTLDILSESKGYISLFIVYEDGHVALLFDNMPIQANQAIEFPDKDSGLELVAELPKRGIKTTDLYLALLTDSPQNYSDFEDIAETILKPEDEFRFGQLVNRIQSPFSSTLIHTLPLSRKIY
ncbi:MAG: LPP20 family lipoprotein [Gammaproteobacteria bacterium]|nr:LPP20 family lipoprotein [Gammaproteobacteria bacterium]